MAKLIKTASLHLPHPNEPAVLALVTEDDEKFVFTASRSVLRGLSIKSYDVHLQMVRKSDT